jgi:SEC-C motif
MLSSRFAGIPISSSTIDGPGVPQLLNRGEQTMRAVTGSGGRLHFGMVAAIKSERWPTSDRNPWPDGVGIRIQTPRSSVSTPASKVGRNDPCPCGSSKKYKKCCGLN